MIRIFITAVLYFIGMFTQVQDNPSKDISGAGFLKEASLCENYVSPCNLQNAKAFEFDTAKFEVINKDLTFESRF